MTHRKQDRRVEDGGAAEEDRRTGAERRQSQRILIDLEVDYRCEDTFLFAYITDLSALGIFVRTNNPEPAGVHLNLRFTLPGDQKPLELEGEVIWINPFRPGNFDNINPGMGVRFVEMSKEIKSKLMRLVRKIAYLEGQADSSSEDLDQAEADTEEDAPAPLQLSLSEEIPVTIDEGDDEKKPD
jgi:type IV pilus assembly protein PilZ